LKKKTYIFIKPQVNLGIYKIVWCAKCKVFFVHTLHVLYIIELDI